MMQRATTGGGGAEQRPIYAGPQLLQIAQNSGAEVATDDASTNDEIPQKVATLVEMAKPSWFPEQPEEVASDDNNTTTPSSSETTTPTGLRWAKRFPYNEEGIKDAKEWVKRGFPAVLCGFPLIFFSPQDPPCPDMVVDVRDNDYFVDYRTTLKGYLDFAVAADKAGGHRGLYAKDVPPPPVWEEHVRQNLHASFLWKGEEDLLGTVPSYAQPESVMCYIGFHGTRTPAHKDIMGTLGHNVMLWAEKDAYAVWMIAPTEHRHKVAEFFASTGQDLEADNGFVSPEQWARAPFPTHVVKQRAGDLVLVPAEAPHMVINQGGVTCKFAWNRMAISNLEISLNSALPNFRKNRKEEKYRAKLCSYFGLKHRSTKILEAHEQQRPPPPHLVKELPVLLRVVEKMIRDEWIDPEAVIEQHKACSPKPQENQANSKPTKKANPLKKRQKVERQITERQIGGNPESVERLIKVQQFPDDEEPFLRTCDICKCDIFNLAFHRRTNILRAVTDNARPEDICLDCVAEGANDVARYRREQYGLYEHIPREELIRTFSVGLAAFASIAAAPPVDPTFSATEEERQRWEGMATMPPLKLTQALQGHGTERVSLATQAASSLIKLWLEKGLPTLPIVCHVCRSSRTANFPELLVRCNYCYKVFCKGCVDRRFDEDFDAMALAEKQGAEWLCYPCRKVCRCSICAPGYPYSGRASSRSPASSARKTKKLKNNPDDGEQILEEDGSSIKDEQRDDSSEPNGAATVAIKKQKPKGGLPKKEDPTWAVTRRSERQRKPTEAAFASFESKKQSSAKSPSKRATKRKNVSDGDSEEAMEVEDRKKHSSKNKATSSKGQRAKKKTKTEEENDTVSSSSSLLHGNGNDEPHALRAIIDRLGREQIASLFDLSPEAISAWVEQKRIPRDNRPLLLAELKRQGIQLSSDQAKRLSASSDHPQTASPSPKVVPVHRRGNKEDKADITHAPASPITDGSSDQPSAPELTAPSSDTKEEVHRLLQPPQNTLVVQ